MKIEGNIIRAQSDIFYPDFYMPDAMAYDIETYSDLGIYGGMNMRTGAIFGMIMRRGEPFDGDRLRRLKRQKLSLGYNIKNFDDPLTAMACNGASTDEIKDAANLIIQSGVKWWDVERTLGVEIPKKWRQSDLMEVNPAIHQSLKTMNGRLMGKEMEDLPIEHDQEVADQEMKLITYWIKDLKATALLAYTLRNDLHLREELGKELGVDLMSKSDSQMGFAVIKKRIEDRKGSQIRKTEIKTAVSFKYKAPPYVKFELPQLQGVLCKIHEHKFVTKADGKVDLPKWLSDEKIVIGPSTFQMGIGGLHSTESKRCILADENNVIVSEDVAGMYPKMMLNLKMYPEAVGPDFVPVFQGIYDDRIKAKKAGDKIKDKGYKIACNGGGFGRLGSKFSITFAPHMLIATTITGQLSLLMLIERAFLKGIPVVSANTDGAEFLCPRSMFNGWIMKDDKPTDRLAPSPIAEIIEQWEIDTDMVLEGVEYTALYNQSVNSYIALKADGSHKRKGPLANPWGTDKCDYDTRGQMMKNPQAYVCSDAVLYFLKNGTPIADTINNCHDVRAFVTVVNATGGATWTEPAGWKYVDDWQTHWSDTNWVRGPGPHSDKAGIYSETRPEPVLVQVPGDEEIYLGKVVRYYWAKNGAPIIKIKPHPSTGNRPKVSKTDGCRPIMTLPDDYAVPEDLDRKRYIDEAYEILAALGYGVRNTVLDLYLSTFTKSTNR